MSLDGVLLSDLRRLQKEQATSFLLVVTGPKGSGKTTTVQALLTGAQLNEDFHVVPSLADCEAVLAPLTSSTGYSDSEAWSRLRVVELRYATVVRECEALCGNERNSLPRQLPPCTVAVLDDVEVVWALCAMNGRLAALSALLRGLLQSPGCALVTTASAETRLPPLLRELRRPVVYPLSPLSQPAARRMLRSLEATGVSFDSCAASVRAVGASTQRRSFLISLCAAKGAEAFLCGGATPDATVRCAQQVLRWWDDASEDARPSPPLHGLQGLENRLATMLAVFSATAHLGATGSLLVAMPSTTGVLLHGPSGCGKSTLTRRMKHRFPSLAFFFVHCSALFSKYLGESEEKLRDVYRKARLSAPAVVVLDDVDVIAQSRGTMQDGGGDGSGGRGVDVSKRMLAGLLCELDGVTDNTGVLTIGTTNAPQVIDTAVLRQGRLETLLYVPPLSLEAAQEVSLDFFSRFGGDLKEASALASVTARRAVGCSPAALSYTLRQILECVAGDDATGHTTLSLDTVPLPSLAVTEGVLFECASVLQRVQYGFECL